MYLDVRWRTRQVEAAKARQRCLFWKKKYTQNISAKKNPKIIIRSLPGFPEKSIIGTMKSETLEVLIPAELAPLVFLCGCQGHPFGVEKSPKNLYERLRRSCELLENLPFKQWFSYFVDCWVPENLCKSLFRGFLLQKMMETFTLMGVESIFWLCCVTLEKT